MGYSIQIHTPPVEDFGKVYRGIFKDISFITEGVTISFRSAKWAYPLEISIPPVGDVS